MITAGNAFLNFIPRSAAIRDPVHAPVPGRGIPTNNTSPQNSYFSIWSFCRIALDSSLSTSGLNVFVPFIQLNTGVIRSKINGTGMIFPIMQSGIAVDTFTPRIGPATSSAPRSSRIGIIEIRNTITSLLTLPLNASIIPCINVLVIRNSSYLFIYFFRNANIASISSLVPTVIRIYCSILSLPQKRT